MLFPEPLAIRAACVPITGCPFRPLFWDQVFIYLTRMGLELALPSARKSMTVVSAYNWAGRGHAYRKPRARSRDKFRHPFVDCTITYSDMS